jgi:hypothetical protein
LTSLFIASCAPLRGQHDASSTGDSPRVRVVVPEVFELANVVMSLTTYAAENPNLIYRNTEYYRGVQRHFGPLRDHPAMRQMQLASSDALRSYYAFRENSITYAFVNDRLARDPRFSSKWSPNRFADAVEHVQTFADTSAFRQFYRDNTSYYADMIARFRVAAQPDSMVAWLEREFGRRYDAYTVVLSPLIYGSHSVQTQRTHSGEEVLAFVSGPDVDGGPGNSMAVRQGFVQRILFTELDHMFVNPASDRFRSEINRVFGDRARWTTDESSFYRTPLNVFNEYMTWSVFFLFADGRLPPADFQRLLELTTQQMDGPRRFHRFHEFISDALQVWRGRAPGTRVVDLYPVILEWARRYSERSPGPDRRLAGAFPQRAGPPTDSR